MEMSAATERLVEQGKAAWESLKKVDGWDQWRTIGYAIEAGRKDIMDQLGINDPHSDSKKFKDEIGVWLKDTGFNEIDKGARSRLHSCMEHLTAIEEWRKMLSPNERVSLNHPNSIWRKFKVTLEDAVPRPSSPNPKDDVIRELQERVEELEAEVEGLRAADERPSAEDVAWEGAGKLAAAEARAEKADAELTRVLGQLDLDTRIRLRMAR
jgi:hypothetical protein